MATKDDVSIWFLEGKGTKESPGKPLEGLHWKELAKALFLQAHLLKRDVWFYWPNWSGSSVACIFRCTPDGFLVPEDDAALEFMRFQLSER